MPLNDHPVIIIAEYSLRFFYFFILPLSSPRPRTALPPPVSSFAVVIISSSIAFQALSCSHRGTAIADLMRVPRPRKLSEVIELRISSEYRAKTETGYIAYKEKKKKVRRGQAMLHELREEPCNLRSNLATSNLKIEKQQGQKRSTDQQQSITPAHTTSNKAAQGFEDFTASQQYHSESLQNMVSETAPYVKDPTFLKQLLPEDGRSGVNSSQHSEHGCDGRGSTPSKCMEPALHLSTQPLGQARPGVALEPPVVAQLTYALVDISQVWAVATLLSHTGEVLLDKLEGKIAEFACPETLEFRFAQLVINGSGKYRIKITLMQMDFSNGFAKVCEYTGRPR
ncbi:hypothetical protein O988_05134 [Pseudogymnoascus sp. VKM F-3808]|nr:hypothetical protein O988_05134 [Pseudogymnoascus sp. VKM F-3808]